MSTVYELRQSIAGTLANISVGTECFISEDRITLGYFPLDSMEDFFAGLVLNGPWLTLNGGAHRFSERSDNNSAISNYSIKGILHVGFRGANDLGCYENLLEEMKSTLFQAIPSFDDMTWGEPLLEINHGNFVVGKYEIDFRIKGAVCFE